MEMKAASTSHVLANQSSGGTKALQNNLTKRSEIRKTNFVSPELSSVSFSTKSKCQSLDPAQLIYRIENAKVSNLS